MKPGIYVHIPFCEQRCYYCVFTIAVSPGHTYEPYVRRVIREIEISQFSDEPETIFFGGGTPSIIKAEFLEAILRALPGGGASAKELSVEANPGTLPAENLKIYRDIGINRISLGAQSFDDRDLETAGRLHKARDVIADFESLRRFGFSNLNIDLIAGLPNQTISGWSENLDWIGRLRPEHVSIYMLDEEENSAWGKKADRVPGPGDGEADEINVRFYTDAADRLGALGYVHYEISNWALPGYECAHNLKYWNGAPYRSFGVSANSFDGRHRFWNSSSLKEYADMIDSGALPIAGRELLTRQMRLDEAFLLGLRQTAGFNIWRVAEDLGIQYPSGWFEAIDEMRRSGWIEFDGGVLRLAPAGWLLASGITQELLWPTLLSTSEATP